MGLVTPILFSLLLGIATSGLAMSNKLSLNNAVREAARYGATVPQNQCDVSATCAGLNWAQVVQSVAVSRSDSALTTSGVCVALVSGPGSAPVAVDAFHTTAGGTAPCFVDNSVETGKRVQVSATRGATIQAMVISKNITLSGQAIARFER